MAFRALPKPPPLCLAVVEGDPVFPAVERRQVVHDAFPSSPPASLPFTPRFPLLLLPVFAMNSSCSSSRSPSRFASFSPWIPNPLHPKLVYLPSLLLELSFASPLDQSTGNPWFRGRRSPVSSSSASTPTIHLRPPFSSLDGSNRP